MDAFIRELAGFNGRKECGLLNHDAFWAFIQKSGSDKLVDVDCDPSKPGDD